MHTYVILLRGINVGGKNKVSMNELRGYLEVAGFQNVRTYINSGNVILQSDQPRDKIKVIIEKLLPERFTLDSELIKVLVLTRADLAAVIDNKPDHFGDNPTTYLSDAIFLMDISEKEALAVFQPREGIDTVWVGKGVIYSQRVAAENTKSRLNKIMASPLYKSMTIRNWNTTTKLLALCDEASA